MKKILFLLLFPVLVFAQTMKVTETQYGNNTEFYCYVAAADSGTTGSEALDLNAYISNISSYPLGYHLYISEISNSNPIIAVYIQGMSSTASWTNVDTVFVLDTVTTTSSTSGTLDLNLASKVFPRYRAVVVLTTALGSKAQVKLSLFAYKRD